MKIVAALACFVCACARPIVRLPLLDQAPETPEIVLDQPAASVGRQGYRARVAAPVEGEQYRWSIANGFIAAADSSGAETRFSPTSLGVLILTVEASNRSGVRAANVQVPVIEPPTELPEIDAPTMVTEGKRIDAHIRSAPAGMRYLWSYEQDGVSRLLEESGSDVDIVMGGVGTAKLSVSAVNQAGDMSNAPGEAPLVVAPKGLSLVAGALGGAGYADGSAPDARVFDAESVATTPDGALYFTEAWDCTVRRLGSDGVLSTVAGTIGQCAPPVDGPGLRFERPRRIRYHADENALFVADQGTFCSLVRIDLPTLSARLLAQSDCTCGPTGFSETGNLTIGPDGGLYVLGDYAVHRVDPDSGAVTPFAGICGDYGTNDDVDPLVARFYGPLGLASSQGLLWVYDDGVLRSVAATGTASVPLPPELTGSVTAMTSGANAFFVAQDDTIFAVTPSGATAAATVAATGFVGWDFDVGSPGVFAVAAGELVQRLDASGATRVAGQESVFVEPPDPDATFPAIDGHTFLPTHILVERDGSDDFTAKITVMPNSGAIFYRYKLDASGNYQATRWLGFANDYGGEDGQRLRAKLHDAPASSSTHALAFSQDGGYYVGDAKFLRKVTHDGYVFTLGGGASGPYLKSGPIAGANLGFISAMRSAPGGRLFVWADALDGTKRLYLIADEAIAIELLRQDSQGSSTFGGFVLGADGRLFLANVEERKVLFIEPGVSGELQAIAGGGGDGPNINHNAPCTQAVFHEPRSMALGRRGEIYLADRQVIQRITLTPECVVDTITMPTLERGVLLGVPGRLNTPVGLEVTRGGDLLITDRAESAILRLRF